MKLVKISIMLIALLSFIVSAFLNLRIFYLLWKFHSFYAYETSVSMRNFEFGLAIFIVYMAFIALGIYLGEIIGERKCA